MDGIDEWEFEFQARCFLDPDGLAEARDDRRLVLMNGEEKRAPFQSRDQKH